MKKESSLTTLLRRLRTGLLASAVMTAIAVTSDGSVTTAAAAQPQSTRFVAHLDMAKGQRPENITLEPDGSAVVTFAYSRQIARITTDGKVRILATLPAPAAGSTTPALSQPFLGGIVRADDGTLYFLYATGSSDLTGVWRLRADGTPQRIAALPAGGPPQRPGPRPECTPSLRGRLGSRHHLERLTGGGPTRVEYRPRTGRGRIPRSERHQGTQGLCVGLNLDQGTMLRIRSPGRAAPGPSRPARRDWPILTTSCSPAPATLCWPRSTRTTRSRWSGRTAATPSMLTGADGLQNHVARVAWPRSTYIASGAYFTNIDPNLLTVRTAARP